MRMALGMNIHPFAHVWGVQGRYQLRIILQHVQSLLCNDREMDDIAGPFLTNGSVNTFPLLGSRFLIMQQVGLQK
jgi:hypothetical protein